MKKCGKIKKQNATKEAKRQAKKSRCKKENKIKKEGQREAILKERSDERQKSTGSE